jgi:hypothetical protein
MKGNHKRNMGPMLSSLRCGAKSRSGKPCKSPAAHGKKRCRMHGGALGSGAPRGNKNALKHGRYTREAIAERAHSGTGAPSAQAALTDRLTCIADHQAAIGKPAIRQPGPKHADFGQTFGQIEHVLRPSAQRASRVRLFASAPSAGAWRSGQPEITWGDL